MLSAALIRHANTCIAENADKQWWKRGFVAFQKYNTQNFTSRTPTFIETQKTALPDEPMRSLHYTGTSQ